MTDSAPPEPIDLRALSDAAQAERAPVTLVRQVAYLGAIVAAASVAPVGREVPVNVACRRRPSRKACPGFLGVRRQQVPPLVRWGCPECGDGGAIERWEGSHWDLAPDLPPEQPEDPGVRVPLKAHELALLLDALGEDRSAVAVLQLARPMDGDLLEISATASQCEAVLQIAAELDEERALPPHIDFEVYMALQHFAGALEDLNLSTDEPREDEQDLNQILLFPEAGLAGETDRRRDPDADPAHGEAQGSGDASGDRDAPTIHRLHVQLVGQHPTIWRRVDVQSDIDLARLHVVLEAAFGWPEETDYIYDHPNEPPGPRKRAYMRREAAHYERCAAGEDVELRDVVPAAGDELCYHHDMHEGWEHRIRVESVRPGELERPRCLAGRRACPPMGAGGPKGYPKLLEVLADPMHPGRVPLASLLAGPLADFDPRAFKVAEANQRLASLPTPSR